jgi:hypothetical protein
MTNLFVGRRAGHDVGACRLNFRRRAGSNAVRYVQTRLLPEGRCARQTHRGFTLLVSLLLSAPALAQTPATPLNHQMPPADMQAPAPSRAADDASAPGVYFGDTSGRTYATTADRSAPACSDATYNQPQMHGSVTTGVVGGGHWGGSFGGATVNMTKAFGSCEHPTGGVSISVSGMQNNVRPHRGGW